MESLTVSIQSEIKWLSFNGDLRPYQHCESSYTELYLLPFWLSLTNTVSEANPNNKLMMRRVGLSGSPAWFALLHQAQNILMFSKINFLTKGCGWCGNCGKGKWKLETFSHISVSQGGAVYTRCFTEVTNRKDSEEVVVSVRPSWMWMVMMTIYEIQTLNRWKLRSYIMATYFW